MWYKFKGYPLLGQTKAYNSMLKSQEMVYLGFEFSKCSRENTLALPPEGLAPSALDSLATIRNLNVQHP
jgi:hypothetical protein